MKVESKGVMQDPGHSGRGSTGAGVVVVVVVVVVRKALLQTKKSISGKREIGRKHWK